MFDFLASLDWFTAIHALITLSLAVAAATPTDKDDKVVGRIANVIATFLPALRKDPK